MPYGMSRVGVVEMVVSGVGLGAVSSGDASGVGWELGVGVGVARQTGFARCPDSRTGFGPRTGASGIRFRFGRLQARLKVRWR